MVLESGKEGPSSLVIRIESGKLVFNRTSDQFLEIPIKIAYKSTRVNRMKLFTLITP